MAAPLRRLVSCPSCSIQYDASELTPGDRFRCGCGELVSVPTPEPHDAAVVRCSACGAPRQGQADRCSFCDSSFTLHERDLHTICPRCTARISDRARYCHSCGNHIMPQASAGEPTDFECPACGSEHRLQSRVLDDRELAVLECGGCAGLWVGNEVFQRLAASAENVKTVVESLGGLDGGESTSIGRIDESQRIYRPCAICGTLMHRRNYGRKSGIIVDTCRRHGVWFDAGELARILRWLESGGAQRSTLEADLERRQLERQRQLYAPKSEPDQLERRGRTLGEMVGPVIDFLGYFT